MFEIYCDSSPSKVWARNTAFYLPKVRRRHTNPLTETRFLSSHAGGLMRQNQFLVLVHNAIKQGKGLSGHAAPPYPSISRDTPPPPCPGSSIQTSTSSSSSVKGTGPGSLFIIWATPTTCRKKISNILICCHNINYTPSLWI